VWALGRVHELTDHMCSMLQVLGWSYHRSGAKERTPQSWGSWGKTIPWELVHQSPCHGRALEAFPLCWADSEGCAELLRDFRQRMERFSGLRGSTPTGDIEAPVGQSLWSGAEGQWLRNPWWSSQRNLTCVF
jgi:hypothetical protein